MLYKHLHGAAKQVDRGKREIRALLTHQVVDADGEVIMADGVDWSRWRFNAPMLFGHDKKIGNWEAATLRKEFIDGTPGWTAVGRLDSRGAVADEVYAQLLEGPMGVSLGFRSKRDSAEKVLPAQRGRTFWEVEVYEASLAILQSCPTCVVLEKSLGFGRADVDLGPIDKGLVLSTLREVVTEEVAWRMKWALLPGSAQVLRLADEEDDVLEGLSENDVLAALREGLHAAAEAGVRRAVSAALGRID